jgi:hypothetical protein
MAEALKIDEDSGTIFKGTVFAGWSEDLVQLGQSYPSIVGNIEKKLAELVANASIQYYYFPEQKIAKVNTLIAEIAKNYGFLTELVDVRYKKANVIVRRQNSLMPTIPSKLLSEVCAAYGQSDQAVDTYILKSDELLNQKKMPNGLYFAGIQSDVQATTIWENIKVHFSSNTENFLWLWMDDDQAFLYFRVREEPKEIKREESADSELIEEDLVIVPEPGTNDDVVQLVDLNTLESQEMPIVLSLAEQCSISLRDLVQSVSNITISPVGGIHFESGRISHYKRRNKDSFRLSGLEKGWEKAVSSWKEEGTVLSL